MVDTGNIGGIIVAMVTIPFILVIGFILFGMLKSSRKGSASAQWPTAVGRIVSSQVTSRRALDSNGTHTTVYAPEVVYQYVVGMQQLQSDNVSFSGVAGTSWSSGAEATVARYVPGSSVQVFYNPVNPSEAVLEHSAGGVNTLVAGVLGGALALVVVLLVLGLTGAFN
ncbi:MAG: hypothetical protein JWL72_377 [Ilumatobacteraceae bacterium]|nr:hypothetical protein [Ilumatobacteraceae bacterium]